MTPNPPIPQYPSSSRPPTRQTRPAVPPDDLEEEDSNQNINRARLLLARLPDPWTLGPLDARALAPRLAAAAHRLGWKLDDQLVNELCTNPGGMTNPVEVLAKRRIPNLRPYAEVHGCRGSLPPACQPCLDRNPFAAHNRRWRTHNGRPCPDCHPDARAAA
ncbi:hypothetical protein ACWGB8_01790 [Kitasatospora sp. NPDC054939]